MNMSQSRFIFIVSVMHASLTYHNEKSILPVMN